MSFNASSHKGAVYPSTYIKLALKTDWKKYTNENCMDMERKEATHPTAQNTRANIVNRAERLQIKDAIMNGTNPKKQAKVKYTYALEGIASKDLTTLRKFKEAKQKQRNGMPTK